jgi:hypothetical protein
MFRISAMESLFADHIKPLLQQDRPAAGVEIAPMKVRFEGVRSTGQCNTACSLSAGVWKPKVFRGR